jgi:ADP-dependent NAD(P)H-hydrate dehydratase
MMSDAAAVNVAPAPPRPADAHKGTFGTVVVIGGSPTMIGAPAMAATAAFRAGAGLVKIMAPPQILPHCLTIEPSATGIYPDLRSLADLMNQKERLVLAVGPGMGTGDEERQAIDSILKLSRPVVLDADGLNNLAALGDRVGAADSPLVLTPHPGEYRRLASAAGLEFDPTDASQRPLAAAALAQRYNAIVVLKGHRTIVSDGSRNFINTTGNAALAAAGSGDILTGLIAGFIAQEMTAMDAGVLGVYIHGLAADLWAREFGPAGLLARELAGLIPQALEAHRRKTG